MPPDPNRNSTQNVKGKRKFRFCGTVMADLRARANGEKFEDDQNNLLRDQIYTLLKQSVDEVKDCGKYVFRKDESRLKGYYSRYNQS